MIDLEGCARQLVAKGKGLLAIDESEETANTKRLRSNGIEETQENRRKFRDLFLSTPQLSEYVSGVILHDETLRQKNNAGVPFSIALHEAGVVPGIKVDQGTEEIDTGSKEVITKGLIGLSERLHEYRNTFHTGFTKWRAMIRIDGDTLPTNQCLIENARRLSQFAKLTQEAGMVAIIEPEVLIEGNHSRIRCKQVLEQTLTTVFQVLSDNVIDFNGVLLKTAMVLSGKETGKIDTPEEVAADTVDVLMKCVPTDILGVVFLSGGQSSDQATNNLAAITKEAQNRSATWPLTFSFARALQDEALAVWRGNDSGIGQAREAFIARLTKVQDALQGE